ncbi:integrator complex subunit 9-like [Hibiscus syriacus]|uniref:Integrator complex subunit 9-like n=1 Tax=Hibiscus syriacus TaxID=106335 RepID=A0A6A3BDB0_HIBSY|nr:integrator complex subunit 9-like [Hibiscus syriacus]
MNKDRLNIDDFEVENEVRPDFPCPYCYEDFDIVSLCSHLEDEHPCESKVAVENVMIWNKHLVYAIGNAGGLYGISFPRLRRVAIPNSQALSLLGRDLREAHLQVLLGGSAYRSSSTNVSNTANDSLLSLLILNFPASEAEELTKCFVNSAEDIAAKNVTPTHMWKSSFDPSLSNEEREKRIRQARGRAGFIQDLVLSTLVNEEQNHDLMNDARMVFNLMPDKDLIAWNAVISALSQNGEDMEAVSLFPSMHKEGVGFNQTTLSTALKSIDSLQSILIDAYGKCTLLEDATRMFRECLIVDLVGFTSMTTAYSQSGQGEEALNLYLLDRGIEPDPYVCSSHLNACANLSAYEQGKQVHVHVLKHGFTHDIFSGNSLVNMYAKCGSIDDAERVFSKIPERRIVSWSAMLGGLAQHGHGKKAQRVFNQMLKYGVSPNQITLVSVLCACNHAGLLTEAQKYFRSMKELFGFEPMQEHYACMIDILGRAGRLDEAMELVNTMPFQADGSVWGALLGAARFHKNVELGQRAAEMLSNLEPEKSSTHVLLANIYASVGMWYNVSKMRRLVKNCNMKKEPGISWIEVKDKIHTFIAGDRSHVQSEELYVGS